MTATVRSEKRASEVITAHPGWEGKVEFAIVEDFTTTAPFDVIFEKAKVPFTYVIHTASPLRFSVNDIQKEMIEPAEMGTREILKSAHKHGKALERVVILGSAVAVLNSFEDITKEGKPYTEKDWNPVTAEQAIEKKDPVLGYNVSKKRAELAAWEFMEEQKPAFDLTVMNPDIITGPMIHYIDGPKSINETNHFAIASFIDGTHKEIEGVTFPFYHSVDVRDVAQAHVDSLANKAASNQRILLIAGLISPQLIANIIRENFPALRGRVPAGNPSQELPKNVHPTGWDMKISLDILAQGTREKKWEYRSLEESVVDAVNSMQQAGVI